MLRYYSKTIDLSTFNLNKTLISTYLLLSATIFFSSIVAFFSISMNVKPIGYIPMFLIYFFTLMLINFFKRSFFGLVLVFFLTGFLGYFLGPVLSSILSLRNGSELVFFSLLLTGGIFFLLSFYAMVTKKNFSFLGNFLFVGSLVILFCLLFNLFFKISLVYLVLSGFFIVFSSCLILYDLSTIINNGESDYIFITISLYLSIYNIFVSLLNIFSFFSERD